MSVDAERPPEPAAPQLVTIDTDHLSQLYETLHFALGVAGTVASLQSEDEKINQQVVKIAIDAIISATEHAALLVEQASNPPRPAATAIR